ncbi:methyltransferase domain-containing protein [bacterium]|nr:methyltransferase domain-containing protein [bacterium]
MYVLETRTLTTAKLGLPSAQLKRPGQPAILQIYSPKIFPLRNLQVRLKGRIRKLHQRKPCPFHLRISYDLVVTSDARFLPRDFRGIPRLQIRAGPAFGTGEHATTRLCLRYVVQFMRKHGSRLKSFRVLDLGCGTGVLGLAAARLGAKVEGWDSDPVAVQEAERNLRLNRLGKRVCFRQRDVLRDAVPAADLIVANLYDHLLLHLLPRLESHRRSGAVLLVSGILKGQENGIIRTATKLGWKLARRGRLGRWFCLQFSAR